ncbi:transcriptional regulator MarR family [Dehalogenimonas sp. WBC-2]|nr:transcriptional regulator MarR family [Dehalogenimonas sp. WBC-2]
MEKIHAFRRLMAFDTQAEPGSECLAHSQWLALRLVSKQEGIGIKELAAQLGITSSAATQLVDGLVNKGLLDRQPSAEDRRSLHLSLPAESRQQIEIVKEQRLNHLSSIFNALDDVEFQTLLNLFDKIINNNTINGER